MGRLSEISGQYGPVSRDRRAIHITVLVMQSLHRLCKRLFRAHTKRSLQHCLKPSFSFVVESADRDTNDVIEDRPM